MSREWRSYDCRALKRLDRHHARYRLDRARDLRRNLKAPRQLHLDLVAVAEHQHHRDFAVALIRAAAASAKLDRLEPPRHAFNRRAVAQEHAQALMHLRRRLIERLDPPGVG